MNTLIMILINIILIFFGVLPLISILYYTYKVPEFTKHIAAGTECLDCFYRKNKKCTHDGVSVCRDGATVFNIDTGGLDIREINKNNNCRSFRIKNIRILFIIGSCISIFILICIIILALYNAITPIVVK